MASSSLASSKGGLENSTKQRIDLVTEQLAGDRSNQKSGGSPLCRGNEAGSLCRHDEEGTSRVMGVEEGGFVEFEEGTWVQRSKVGEGVGERGRSYVERRISVRERGRGGRSR